MLSLNKLKWRTDSLPDKLITFQIEGHPFSWCHVAVTWLCVWVFLFVCFALFSVRILMHFVLLLNLVNPFHQEHKHKLLT